MNWEIALGNRLSPLFGKSMLDAMQYCSQSIEFKSQKNIKIGDMEKPASPRYGAERIKGKALLIRMHTFFLLLFF